MELKYVSPEYQEQLDNLAETLRQSGETEQAIDAFEEVFLPRAFFQQGFEEVE